MPFDSTNYPVTVVEDSVTLLLREARALIEKGWCQGSYARDRNGVPCSAMDDDAVSFCSLGAIDRASDSYSYENSIQAIDRLGSWVGHTGSFNVVSFNDFHRRTKEDVLALYDKAIENG